MSHPLETLGPERFQQLCQALLVQEFPNVVCYPVGQPDGGRDAIRLLFDEPEGQFIVYQVKYARTDLTGAAARDWVLNAANGEVEKAQRLKQRGANQYVFVTNVAGTSHLDVGSMDKLQSELSQVLGMPVTCWWRDDINRRLDGSWDIKLRYPEVLSGQDFLRLLVESSNKEHHEKRLNAIRAFLAHQYQEDQEVKFKQVELQNKLLDLFVDLPFRVRIHGTTKLLQNDARFIAGGFGTVTDRENGIELTDLTDEDEHSGTATLLLSEWASEFLNQVVVEGAPGQGKSTLAQYLCQVHRIRLLNKKHDLECLPLTHKISPVCIPFKVDLRDLSEWLSGSDPFLANEERTKESTERSVETFLARLVEHGAGGVHFSVNDLLELAKITPLFIALDGLDEVADIKRRADVVAAVSKALPRLRENCRGLRVLVTSRPAAFANSPGFDSKQFPYLQLGSVKKIQITRYAAKWMEARSLSPSERKEFESVLNEKLDQPHLRDLSRNPMQLTILLSLIHTKGAALPDKRTTLYDAYVDLFFSRESTKNVVVRKHLDLLKDIHRYLGWVLHSSVELTRGTATDGRLTSNELRDVLDAYLKREGQSTTVIDEIFNAMLERVVMIVSRIEGTHEFEVQPLREYFAARYLYDTASYSPTGRERPGTKPDRFDAIARNPYWLNVVRFFCGCFSKGELLDLADQVTGLTKEPSLGRTKHPVALCAMLLSDWVFSQSPRAVAEVATALSSRAALRKLIPTDIGYRNEEPLRIPDSCGGRGIRLKAFDFLFDSSSKHDLRRRLAKFIVANSDPAETMERWKSVAPTSDADFAHWLGIGRDLNCLQNLSKNEIQEIIGARNLSIQAVAIFWQIGCEGYIATTAANAEALSRYFLSANYYWRSSESTDAPFYLVPEIYKIVALLGIKHLAGEILEQTINAILEFRKEEEKVPHDINENIRGLSEKCYRVSQSVAKRLNADTQPTESMAFWAAVVDDCSQILGEHPMTVIMAISLTNMPSGKKGRLPKQSLFDSDTPLVGRVRYTKSQANRWEWWQEALKAAATREDRFLAHLTLWAWASTSLIIENSDVIAKSLDALLDDEWSAVLVSCEHVLENIIYARPKLRKVVRSPYSGRSKRFALLLALKEPIAYGQSIFLSLFLAAPHGDDIVRGFCQSQAIQAATDGQLSWDVALKIVKSTYATGTRYIVRNLQGFPDYASEEVMEHLEDYPAMLWDRVQAKVAMNERKKIRPVAQIAKRDRWFTS